MSRRIVSDTGPIISLEKLSEGFDLIRLLYDQILIPEIVLTELAAGEFSTAQEYIEHYQLEELLIIIDTSNRVNIPNSERLHAGELEAIQLAKQLDLPLLIEETIGRQCALEIGLKISGIAGQLLRARRLQLISETLFIEQLNLLLAAGRINQTIYDALRSAPRTLETPNS